MSRAVRMDCQYRKPNTLYKSSWAWYVVVKSILTILLSLFEFNNLPSILSFSIIYQWLYQLFYNTPLSWLIFSKIPKIPLETYKINNWFILLEVSKKNMKIFMWPLYTTWKFVYKFQVFFLVYLFSRKIIFFMWYMRENFLIWEIIA